MLQIILNFTVLYTRAKTISHYNGNSYGNSTHLLLRVRNITGKYIFMVQLETES